MDNAEGHLNPPQATDFEDYRIVLDTVDHLDAMVAYWDINRICRFANNAYRTWFGRTRDRMIGITIQELLGSLYEKSLPYINAAYNGNPQVYERDIQIPTGEIRHSLTTYTPDIVNGQVQGIFVHVADVTPLKKLEQELRAAKEHAEMLATHDFLTGLPNRSLLMDRLNQMLAYAKRKQQMVAVFSLDIDNFKVINDTYGHAGGDQLLVTTAQRMKETLRSSDTIVRLGGDEFLLLLPDIHSPTHAAAFADRMLAIIRQPIPLNQLNTIATFSVGIALYPLHGSHPTELIISSDRALYMAKERGKDCYMFADLEATV